jgi:acyl-CoA thioester hydrolase
MSSHPFPFYTEIATRFRDLDAFGHVNNAVYFTYMETARFRFLQQFLTIDEPADASVILGEAQCRFLSPVLFDETLRVGVAVSRFGNKSFDILYHFFAEDGMLVAAGLTAMVMYNYATQETLAIPDDFRQRILDFQGGWRPPS